MASAELDVNTWNCEESEEHKKGVRIPQLNFGFLFQVVCLPLCLLSEHRKVSSNLPWAYLGVFEASYKYDFLP